MVFLLDGFAPEVRIEAASACLGPCTDFASAPGPRSNRRATAGKADGPRASAAGRRPRESARRAARRFVQGPPSRPAHTACPAPEASGESSAESVACRAGLTP